MQKALSNAIGQDGGYRVQAFQDPEIEAILYDSSPVRAVASVSSVGTSTYEKILKDTRIGAAWVSELGTRTAQDTSKIAKITIPVHELYSYQYLTHQHLEDAGYDVIGETSRDAAEEFARAEATAFVTGDGVDRPRGFTTYTAKTSNPDVYTRDQVGTKVANTTGTVTTDELIDLKALIKVGYRQNLTWGFNRATEAILRKLKYTSGTNEYIWQMSLQAGEPSVLLGVPVAIMEDTPDMSTGNIAVTLADFKRCYKVVDRLGISMLDDPFTGGSYRICRYRYRVGGGLVNFDAIKQIRMA
jgi:HK97 family phage major capsid protein